MRRESAGGDVLLHVSETRPLTALSWDTLGNRVRTLATQLRALGRGARRPGGRLDAEHPRDHDRDARDHRHRCDLGVLLAGLRRARHARSPRAALTEAALRDRRLPLRGQVLRPPRRAAPHRRKPALTRTPDLPAVPESGRCHAAAAHLPCTGTRSSIEPAVPAAQFRYEQVPFDHPLWTLFSSGTTGLPKPIVHGHGGILLEILKNGTFHFDLHPGERVFYFTTTGWMLWNFLTGTPLTGAVPVLYDGHPAYPTPDVLWKMADEAGVVTFGASPTYVDQLSRSGIVPRTRYQLRALRTVNLAGSPATPESMAWFYRNVKQDLWVANGSGGTDCCTGFVGGVPTLPGARGRDPGALARGIRQGLQRPGRERHRRGRANWCSPSPCPRCRCASGTIRATSATSRPTSRNIRASGATGTSSGSTRRVARSCWGARTRPSTATACAWARPRSTARSACCRKCRMR